MIVWRIALRNLREHKTKTIIVGVLIAVAMTILVAGNSLMDSLSAQMEAGYRDTYTGDLVVHGESEYTISLFGVQGLDQLNAAVPVLPNYEEVERALQKAEAATWSGIVQTRGTYLHDEQSAGFSTLWGIEPDAYLQMFGAGIEILEGDAFARGERAILLNQGAVEQIQEQTGIRYRPGDTIKISTSSPAGGARIREVPIAGIFTFAQENPLLGNVSLVDLATARELAGLDVERVTREELSSEEQAMLGSVEEEELFGGSLFGENPDATDTGAAGSAGESGALNVENVLGEVAGQERQSAFELERYHFVIAKADSARSSGRLLSQVRSSLASVDETVVSDWQWAAGPTITLVTSVQIIFNVVAIIISIVSVIIIVNTLVVSISERIPEIGTIRAIGGKKRLVRKLISRETLVITGVFGVIGMVVGALLIGLVRLVGIEADTTFLQLLLGGEIFRPHLSASAVISSLLGVGVMAWIASLYPVHMATRISPVAAMQRG